MRHQQDYVFDFTNGRPSNSFSLVTSSVFKELVSDFVLEQKDKMSDEYQLLLKSFKDNDSLCRFLSSLLKSNYQDVVNDYPPLSSDKVSLIKIIDGIYDFWRHRQRYVLLDSSISNDIYELINNIDSFSRLVISTYRTIYENVLGNSQRVYRELPSGANAGFLLTQSTISLPEELNFLNPIKYVESMMVKPPFIVYTDTNTRKGFFKEKKEKITTIDPDDFVSIGLKISDSYGLCYFSKHYLEYIVGLGNLFEFATVEEMTNQKPSFIMLFGVKSNLKECYYYKTDDNVLVGICPESSFFDYFGYVKKMILTLHNLTMIQKGYLPIHGAGIEVVLNSGKKIFISLLGDSGAGKSETIEAFKSIENSGIADIRTIYDDMGTFIYSNKQILATGTETGAFVRLDDLDTSYSIKSIDRAIYFNPDLVNSRVVVPLTTYNETRKRYKVDVFLLADNYSEGPTLERYQDRNKAKEDFIKGERMAMKTTSEKGIVSTFFANPFGPLQEKEKTEPIIDSVFDTLFDSNVFVGRIRTRLAIDPRGAKIAAEELLKLISNLK